MTTESGAILLDGDIIRYRSKHYGNWDLALGDVRVIGELTNDHGPMIDDYFLCFANGADGWYEASMDAEGTGSILEALSRRFKTTLALGLQCSTQFASRVLWPTELAGQAMFRFTDDPSKSWLKRLLGVGQNLQTYSEKVQAFLAAGESSGS